MKFELTYHSGGDVYSANIVYAADEKAARAWYERVLHKSVVGCREMVSPWIKPGQPVVDVPMNYSDIVSAYPV